MRGIASRIGQLHGEGAMSVYERALALERAGKNIIHLELGEPDFHPAPEVIAAAEAALRAGRDRYCPPCGVPQLRAAIAEYLRRTRGLAVDAASVVVTSGCKLALNLAMTALIEPGDEVLCPDPSFPIYPSFTRGLGAQPVWYALREENHFQPDLDEVRRAITPRTRVLILCSPNNPTGTVYRPDVLAGLAELACRHDLAVISDEIYARLVYGNARHVSIASLAGMAERTVVIDGFSKSFAMTGWRLGYAVAPPSVVQALEMLVVNSFTCAPEFIQLAAVTALEDRGGYVEAMRAEYARRREQFAGGLADMAGLRCRLPEGAFYAWARVINGETAEAVQQRMLEEAGVAAIPGRGFGPGGAEYLRFSFAGATSELEEALARMRRLFEVQ